MSKLEKEFEKALAIRREILHEIKEGKASRRAMLKTLLYTSGALAALRNLRGGATSGSSGSGGAPVRPASLTTIDSFPRTPAFMDELPHLNLEPHVKQPVRREDLDPPPEKEPNPLRGEARRNAHQLRDLAPPQKFYELHVKPGKHKFHLDLDESDIWGFDGIFPGPTFHARYGTPIVVRIRNELPFPHFGFGSPEISTHLHNLHQASESDGNPDDFYPKRHDEDFGGRDPGTWKDHHYPNKYAGFNSTHKSDGDPREALRTLWYHDHRVDFTSHNVYKGLAGFYLLFDDADTGDETTGLRLPSGEFDVPLILGDKLFTPAGRLDFDQFNFDGLLGNKVTVNGKILPYFRVKRRRYRFRALNSGPARIYDLALRGPTLDSTGTQLSGVPLWPHIRQIGAGGNLLERALTLQAQRFLGPAMRREVIVDFTTAQPGEFFYLVDRIVQTNGRMPQGFTGNDGEGPHFRQVNPGDIMMRLDVVADPVDDASATLEELERPQALGPSPDLPFDRATLSEADILRGRLPPGVERVRTWRFDRSNGQWTVNNRLYNGEEPGAELPKNAAEIWVLQNNSNGWVHPIHIHLEEFRPLFRALGQTPLGQSDARRDTVLLGPGERLVLFMRFRDFEGRYVMHCHNVMHEDHAMMVRWDVGP